jgi:hypothetical protein
MYDLANLGAAVQPNAGDLARQMATVLTVREQPFADVCQSKLRQAINPGSESSLNF